MKQKVYYLILVAIAFTAFAIGTTTSASAEKSNENEGRYGKLADDGVCYGYGNSCMYAPSPDVPTF